MQRDFVPESDGAAPLPASGQRPGSALRGGIAAAAAVAVAHAVNDAYVAFLPPLLPRIMDALGINIALAATLAMVLSLAAALPQPVMGSLADRFGRRLLMVLGPLLSVVFLSLIGSAPSFAVLIMFLALGGLGSAAFHPPAASIAARVGDGGRSGLRLSVFSFGGSAGYAVGPLIAVAIVARVGLEGLWLAMVPGIVIVLAAAAVLPADRAGGAAVPPPSPPDVLALLRGPIGVIFGISIVFAFAQRVFLTMAPISVAVAGGSEATGAFALSAFLAGQALGGFAGGFLADRVDRRLLLLGITILAFPAHMGALWLVPGGAPTALAFAAAAGFLNMAILPPIVVMAQEIVPARAALGSGIVMGLAWAVGSVGVLGTGVLADAVGPQAAALISTPVLLAGALLAFHPALAPFRRSAGGQTAEPRG